MTESQCSCRSLSLAQRTSVCGNLPGKSAVLQLILSVITKFYLCFECFIIRIYSFRETQQRNYRRAEFTEFFTYKNTFAFPECISSPTSAVPCPGKSCRSSNWNPLMPGVFKARSISSLYRMAANFPEACRY